jgi:CheY-like chemotaxis protein
MKNESKKYIKEMLKKMSFLRILIVEDDEIYIATYRFAIERHCKSLDVATNERDAIKAITDTEKRYDVVITDGAFPEYEGASFMGHNDLTPEDFRGKNIAKIAKEKGVFVIGISSEPKILQSENIDILLKKPYDVYELWEAIIT